MAQEEEGLEAVLLTPAMLWYYVYTIGGALFCLSYTLHGAHFVSSFCLCLSSLGCALWVSARESKHIGSLGGLLALIGIFNVCSLGVLGLRGLEEKLWQNWAFEMAGPLMAPFWLAGCRHKARPLHVPSHHVVLFGLPFVCVLSLALLSVFVVLPYPHTTSHNVSAVVEQALLVSAEAVLHQSPGEVLLGGLVVPAAMFAGLVMYVGAFMRSENLLLCMNGLWVVFVGAEWAVEGGLSALLLALAGWLLSLAFVLLHVKLTEGSRREEETGIVQWGIEEEEVREVEGQEC